MPNDRLATYWRKDAIADPASLRDGAVDLLCAMDLVAIYPHGRVRPWPAAARFAPEVAVAGIDDPDQQVPAVTGFLADPGLAPLWSPSARRWTATGSTGAVG